MNTKTVTIVCGCPGAGKSTYGRSLANARGAVLLDIDTCSERLVMKGMELAGQNSFDRDSPFFKEHYREEVYQTLFDVAHENIGHCNVVIVGPFTKEIRDENWLDFLRDKFECRVMVVYLRCDPQERLARLIARANPRDEGKFDDYESFNKYYGDESPPCFEHSLIDTSKKSILSRPILHT